MKKRLLFILGLIFVAANLAMAQTKTVTNADLEKFRQKRLQAEREYRENYEKLGFPSPEELERQREQDRRELSELSARLERDNLVREQKQREDAYWQTQNEAARNYNYQYNQGRITETAFIHPFISARILITAILTMVIQTDIITIIVTEITADFGKAEVFMIQ